MPGRKPRTAIGAKFDRCTRKVRRRGGVADPEAVCAAALNRAHPGALARARAKARRNPTMAQRFRDCVDANNGKTVQDPADYCAAKLSPRANPVGRESGVVLQASVGPQPSLMVVHTLDEVPFGRLRVAPGYFVRRGVAGVTFGRAWFRRVAGRWELHASEKDKTVRGRVTPRGFEVPDAQAARLSHVDHAAIARYVPMVAARANPCGCQTKRR